jgi:hypothetical protein
MAKKTIKPMPPTKLYACCRTSECKTLQQMIDFLKLWGIDHQPRKDGKGWYFDVSIPLHWGDYRVERFAEGLAKQPTGH